MSRSRATLTVIAVAVIALVASTRSSEALHRRTPAFLQITEQSSGAPGAPSFAGRSNVLLFESDGDLLGNGNETSQIFVFDLAGRVKKQLPSLYQVTFGTAGSHAPSGAKRAKVLAFHSDADLLGNGSTGRQIFASTTAKWKKALVPLFQVTRGPGTSFDPVVSEAGKYMAFSSTDDLLGDGLAPGVHLYVTDLRRLAKGSCPGYPCPGDGNPGLVLASPEEPLGVAIDKNGRRVAFASRADAAGTGCGVGTSQIFTWAADTGVIEQVTCGAADSRHPAFTRNYRGLVFDSDADLVGTSAGHTQIFHLDLFAAPHILTQVTFGSDGDSSDPAPNGTASRERHFFVSTADLTGAGGAGTRRVYMFEEGKPLLRLTDGQEILSRLTGQFLFGVFTSDADLVGNGNDTPQLFLVNAYAAPQVDPTPTPTVTYTPTPTATPTPGPQLQRIALAPATTTVSVGDDETYTATGYFGDGTTQNITQLVTYVSSAPSVAAATNPVGNHSRVDAVAPGMATISAFDPGSGVSSSDTGDDATMHVLGALVRIVVTPTTKTLSIGEFQFYTAIGHYSDGGTQNLTQQVTYVSSDTGVAVAANTPGTKSQVDAVGAGTATISAFDPATGVSSSDTGDDATLTVNGPLESITLTPVTKTLGVGGFETYTATGHYGGGGTQNITQQVTYASSDPGVAVAPNTSGNKSRVDAVGPGMATISAVDPATGVSSTTSGGDATLTVVAP
jgi:Tol biopolymer transport system component